ncbi:mucoidy inhibitor MuiA family protein [Williamwhitmania taraxaci]|uniref:Mucoidy inhibitor MuiA family protein n=1 Tax=Williamwhitmania taraxaci TaxID=1640674 RepID=A0A1G6QS68_9BACT|nr:mucoidy inhibitor MuiA family protein [Williamwhitmania taraxaci]SDC95219.1 conserved hypothetical protein [Williamwhitmania taraxaci]
MKHKLIAIVTGTLLTFSVAAQVPVNSKIERVTVFVTGAQITRTATLDLKAGTTELVLGNLSPYINAQSISAGLSNEVTILSVNQGIDYLNQQGKTEEIAKLQLQQKNLQEKIKLEQNRTTILQQEENLLLNNQKLGSQNAGMKVLELREAADFFRNRLTEISNMKMEALKSVDLLNLEINKINRQLQELNGKVDEPTGVIKLVISSKTATRSQLTLSYLVANASWNPYYDLRILNINHPVTIGYMGTVAQSCGENWENVKLVLSSGDPSRSGLKPEINPWYLSIYEPPIYRRSNAPMSMQKMETEMDENVRLEEVVVTGYGVVKEKKAFSKVAPDNMRTNETTAEFEVVERSNIPSNNNTYNVSVAELTVPAFFNYESTPKLDKAVFLSAGITGWEAFNLMDGQANLYFEGTYVGSTYLDTKNASDTMSISLGRDKAISINREKVKDFSATQMLSSQRKDTRTWEITVRNNKAQKIALILEDQIPLSSNSDIVVEKGDLSGAELEEKTGKLTWKLNMEPKETKKIKFSYSVKYPKKGKVILE